MEIHQHFDSVLAIKDLVYSQSIASILKQNLSVQDDVFKGAMSWTMHMQCFDQNGVYQWKHL